MERKDIKSAQDAGFPSTKKQILTPERKPKKYAPLEAVAAKKPRLDETSMPLKDVNNKWSSLQVSPNMAAMHSYLPPLGEKRALSTATQLPPSKALKEPKYGPNKENRVIKVPPLPKQSSITDHTVHQFKPKDMPFKIPEVKKLPQKNVGKYSNKLPRKIKHRVCPLCFKLYPSKASRNPGGLTPHLHVVTSECSFVRANCVNVVAKLTCYGCFEKFQENKLINEDIVSHFEITDHDVICHVCRKVMPYSHFYDHLVKEVYNYYEIY